MQTVYYLVDIKQCKKYTKELEGDVPGTAARAIFLAGRGETMCAIPVPDRTNCTSFGRYLVL